jgi:hypothetical protein
LVFPQHASFTLELTGTECNTVPLNFSHNSFGTNVCTKKKRDTFSQAELEAVALISIQSRRRRQLPEPLIPDPDHEPGSRRTVCVRRGDTNYESLIAINDPLIAAYESQFTSQFSIAFPEEFYATK